MSQPKRLDIAEFFRPYGKTIPQKRATSDRDDLSQTRELECMTPTTPKSLRESSYSSPSARKHVPSKSAFQTTTTPKNGRTIDIPIRSPATGTPRNSLPVKRSSLFEKRGRLVQSSDQNISLFSFADLRASDRSVVEDGKLVAVRDSDDSDDSLESLSELIGSKKRKSLGPSSSQTDEPLKQEEERRRMLNLFTGGLSEPILRKDKMRELQRLEQANKVDLSFIFEEERKEERLREQATRADAELEASTREMEESTQADPDKRMLTAILQGDNEHADPEELARLLSAVDRTEALTGDRLFRFFGSKGTNDLSKQKRAKARFPASAIPVSLWNSNNTAARDRMYLSGFVATLAQSGQVTDEAIRWTFDAILGESCEELRASYMGCVAVSSSWWTRANVTPEDIHKTFETLGADSDILRDGKEVKSTPQPNHGVRRQDFQYLIVALELFHSISQDMDFATLGKLSSTICRLSLDQQVIADNRACLAVQDLLTKLINHPDLDSQYHIHERLFSDLSTNIKEPALQAQFLLQLLPTSPVSARFRIKIATMFLIGCESPEECLNPSTSLQYLGMLTNHLSASPLFTMTKSKSILSSAENYKALKFLTIVLDAAIADGHPPSAFANRSEEENFNIDVDQLANHIHSLFVSIADSGASHMRRTEAKEVLQELHVKLLHAIRTKPKKKRHVFDAQGVFIGSENKNRIPIRDASEIEQEARGREFMAKFLNKKSVQNNAAEKERIIVNNVELKDPVH